jgi:dienelactone hydrolase
MLGFSMGGLAADNLARKYQIPVLSFNPALAYRSFEPAANPWPGLQLAVQHHIVLGELDTNIPPATTRALVAASAEPYTLHPEPLLPHRTNWLIFEKYAQRLLTGHL